MLLECSKLKWVMLYLLPKRSLQLIGVQFTSRVFKQLFIDLKNCEYFSTPALCLLLLPFPGVVTDGQFCVPPCHFDLGGLL